MKSPLAALVIRSGLFFSGLACALAQFPASPEPDGLGRTFDVDIVNGRSQPMTVLISGFGISCCDSPRADMEARLEPGESDILWIARTQGNDCDGENGTFAIVDLAGDSEDSQAITFDNGGNLSLANVPTTYQTRLSPRDPETGKYTLTFLPIDLNQVVVNTNDSGPGSLRRAVSFGGRITFAPELNGETIRLTSGPIMVPSDVTIDASALSPGVSTEAAEPVLSTQSAFQFQVAEGATLTTSGLSSFFTTGVDFPWGTTQPLPNGLSSSSLLSREFNESSYLERTVTGPGVLEYSAATQSELHEDVLRVFLDGEELHENGLSGEFNDRDYTIPIPAGIHTVRWQFDKNGSDDDESLLDIALITSWSFSPAVFELADALDTSDFPLATTGDAAWSGQALVAHDGADAGQSGDIGDNDESRLETTVTFSNPTLLTFWWKVSCEPGFDSLRFRIDGAEQASVPPLSGNANWEQVAIVVPAGEHTLSWTYQKDGSVSRFADRGWVDQIGFDSIPEALNTPELEWETFGNGDPGDWTPQTAVSLDGVVALKSGTIGDNGISLLQSTVKGPGFLYFSQKVSSQQGGDFLRFSRDGSELESIPAISGEVDWESKGIFIPPGSHTIRWEYTKDGSISGGSDAAWLDLISYDPLAEGVDAAGLDWNWSGNNIFYTQTAVSRDGIDAAQSGSIGDNQTARIETSVTGPGQLKFWWKVSSEASFDFLRFRIDGEETPEALGISGERGWEQKTILVPPGNHVLSWDYSKDGSVSRGDDAGWVDKVVYSALVEGTDAPELVWTTSGDKQWFSQTSTSLSSILGVDRAGIDAVQSGDIGDNQSSRLETTVTGPAEVRFFWKVSSQKDHDFLRFRIDGVEDPGIPAISGDFYPRQLGTGWKLETALVPAGPHTLSWTYEKDGSISSVADTGWVDRVLVSPPGFATWVAENVPEGQDASFYGDANQNGVSNGLEYVFNGMPIEYPEPGVVTAPPEPSKPDILLYWQSSADLLEWENEVRWNRGNPPSISGPVVIEDGVLRRSSDESTRFFRFQYFQYGPYRFFTED